MLIDASVSRLPPLLTAYAGMTPGFMIAHVTAAALASENKSLAHPASVDILPMSANQEDHVSMATFAARRLKPMIRNTAHILGIELLAAAQGVESSGRFHPRRPFEPWKLTPRSSACVAPQLGAMPSEFDRLELRARRTCPRHPVRATAH